MCSFDVIMMEFEIDIDEIDDFILHFDWKVT